MDDNGGSGAAQAGIVVGGALALLASFLPWATLNVSVAGGLGQGALGGRAAQRFGRGILQRLLPGAGVSRSVAGVRLSDGRAVLGIGVALVVIGALGLIARSGTLRAISGGIAAALGVLAFVIAVAAAALPADTGGAGLQRVLRLQAHTGSGLYLALAAAAIAAIAGTVAFVTGGPSPTDVVPVAPVTPYPRTVPPAPAAPHQEAAQTEVIPTVPPEA